MNWAATGMKLQCPLVICYRWFNFRCLPQLQAKRAYTFLGDGCQWLRMKCLKVSLDGSVSTTASLQKLLHHPCICRIHLTTGIKVYCRSLQSILVHCHIPPSTAKFHKNLTNQNLQITPFLWTVSPKKPCSFSRLADYLPVVVPRRPQCSSAGLSAPRRCRATRPRPTAPRRGRGPTCDQGDASWSSKTATKKWAQKVTVFMS